MFTFFKDEDDNVWKTPTTKFGDFNYPSTSSLMNTSNLLDHTPTSMINRITNSTWADLPQMLTSLGLEKYVTLLTSHEIDLTTFPSLTEQDLLILGVKSFGARRKMMLAISG